MKKILILLLSIFLNTPIWCQTESCMAVIQELSQKRDLWSNQDGIDYILSNKDSFDMQNELDIWFYSIALGTRYYPLEKYNEALPFLQNITKFCDTNENEIGLASNPELLSIYYWETVCEYKIGTPKDVYLNKLQRAKEMYEKYNQTNSNIYNQIINDIEITQYDFLPKATTALQYAISGNTHEAIKLFEEIINYLPSSYPIENLAGYIQGLGNCYISVGRLNDAEQIYLKTLTELKNSNKESHECYRNLCDALGVLYCQVHNYQKAKDYSGLSKYLHEINMDFDDSYIRCLSNCALIESSLGNYYMAKLFVDVALKYLRQGIGYNSSKKLTNTLSELASTANINLNDEDISEQTNRMLQIRPYIQILSNAAIIYEKAGFWNDAVLCIKESIKISEEINEPYSLNYNNLATLYLSQSKVKESLAYFEKAISICKTEYEKNELWFNYALALWLSNSNQCVEVAAQASKYITESIANNFSFLSQDEKYNYYEHFEQYLPFLNLMFYENKGQNQYGYIYNNILTTKGLLLRTANGVKNTILSSGNENAINDYNRMILLRQQMTNERDSIQLIKLREESEKLDKRLSRSAAEYGAFIKSNNVKWQDICKTLKDDEIAIEFYNIPIIYKNDTIQKIGGEPRYCAVFLKRGFNNPQIIPLCKESELEELDFEDLYNSHITYKLIWEPIKSALAGINTIYFSADRKLHQIGIEYALLPNNNRIDEKYNIYRLSSTRILAENRHKSKSNNVVLFGGLKYDIERDELITESRTNRHHSIKASRSSDLDNFRYGVDYLPGTQKEVEAIANNFKLFNQKKCKTITDIDGIHGTEETFRELENKNFDIIHLATHGFFWTEEDVKKRSYTSFLKLTKDIQNYEDAALLRSGLFFSGANIGLSGEILPDDVEDGVLTAKELSTLNLGNVDMVVLSACQSGLGETSEEGVFGLQRGFKLAGANSLLMSLWKVDDDATKILMTEFYRNMLSGKGKMESLREARQYVANQPNYKSPDYWASFILLDALN